MKGLYLKSSDFAKFGFNKTKHFIDYLLYSYGKESTYSSKDID